MKLSDKALFGQSVTRVARYWRREIDQALGECGLSQATALPLLILSRRGRDARQRAIADELGIEGPSLVRVIELLVSEGLVTRKEDPSDRRAKMLNLTDKGHRRVEQIEAAIGPVRERFLADIPARDLAIALRVLKQVEETIQEGGE